MATINTLEESLLAEGVLEEMMSSCDNSTKVVSLVKTQGFTQTNLAFSK